MTVPRIRQVRAFVVRGGGADYHDQAGGTGSTTTWPLAGEPVPERGRLKVPERPGFGVELDPASKLERPYTH